MKKVIFALMAIAMFGTFTGCKCTNEKADETNAESAEIVLDSLISADRQYMLLNYGSDYKLHKSCVQLDNFLDADTTVTVYSVSNIFQTVENTDEASLDTKAISIAHGSENNGNEVKELRFWVLDDPLNEEDVKVTLTQAIEMVRAANYPKPHSRHVVLRKEVGPNPNANAQYVFGNSQAQLYVDAVTGEVTDKNPAFKGFGLTTKKRK